MDQLTTRSLGRTGLEITSIGLGTWAMGGPHWARGWGVQDDRDSIDTILAAVERGIGWVDTAPAYGRGHAERLVGAALSDLSADERPLVFTKCGLLFDPDRPLAAPRRHLTPASIRAECDASLSRLGVERLDLLQIHWPPESGAPLENSWGALLELVDAGKVAAVGVSNFTLEQLEICQRAGPVTSVQAPFSLIRRDVTEHLLPWCEQRNVGVLAYSPMQSGLLAGRFSHKRVAALPSDDWRAKDAEFTEPRLSRNLALADVVREIAARRGVEPGAVAVAWTLAWPQVTAAVVGARTPAQLGWVADATATLTPDELASLEWAVSRTGAGSGPASSPGDAGDGRRVRGRVRDQ